MKNIAIINSCDWGSTGKIGCGMLENFQSKGFNTHFYYGRGKKPTAKNRHKIENEIEVYVHALLSKLTGLQGGFSYFATSRMIKSFKQNNIDTVFMISMHGYYLNETLLFDYIGRNNIRLIYTMIDEYAYLGNCCNEIDCTKILTGKGKCPNKRKYPESLLFDSCSKVLSRKIKNYKKLNNAIFVGPEFLVNNSKRSILGKYMNTVVLDEAIDLQLYNPRDPSELKKQLGLDNEKRVILCVAPSDRPLRGANYFIEAAKKLSNDNRYVFIHVGYKYNNTNGLPDNFIPISFVEEDDDMAKYYSMADILINPSIADAMSNTCLEALACGTPIVCFNISGMPYLMDETVGKLIPPYNVDAIVTAITGTVKKTPQIVDICRNYALKRYDNRKYADRLLSIAKGDNI